MRKLATPVIVRVGNHPENDYMDEVIDVVKPWETEDEALDRARKFYSGQFYIAHDLHELYGVIDNFRLVTIIIDR